MIAVRFVPLPVPELDKTRKSPGPTNETVPIRLFFSKPGKTDWNRLRVVLWVGVSANNPSTV